MSARISGGDVRASETRLSDMQCGVATIWLDRPERGNALSATAVETLSAAVDAALATPDATFRFPGSAFGIVLGTRRLVELIGWDRARPLVTEGAMLEALAAQAAGLVTDVVEGDAPRRRPESATMHRLVQESLESFLAPVFRRFS